MSSRPSSRALSLRTVTATVPTGAGAKSVDVAPRTGRVVVVNRLAGDVSVIDPRTAEVVATVPTGPSPTTSASPAALPSSWTSPPPARPARTW